MTRILMVAKFREVRGGAERHLHDLIGGLRRRGHDVTLFSSEDVEAAGGFVFTASTGRMARVESARALLWNSAARTLLARMTNECRPDVVHFHGVYHQLSPSVLGVCDVPAVMTLHDNKLAAPCYALFRDGDVCQACVGKMVATPAIRYKCVKGSTLGSALCVVEDVLYRRRYRRLVDRFIVPSRFSHDVAVRGGLPAERVSVIPWGVAVEPVAASTYQPRVAFFGGRLERMKGLQVLLDAWESMPAGHGCVLRIAGRGELENKVKAVAQRNPSVQFLGLLPGSAVLAEARGAAIAMVPSLMPETMGLAAIESLIAGTPVVASDHGALVDLRGPGVWTLPQVDVEGLRTALVRLLLENEEAAYREALSRRDLSLYRFDGMLDAIEAQYVRAGA